MKDFIFTSVAFGEKYIEQIKRLKSSILSIYPDANIKLWEDELPEGSKPFLDSLYGFKVYAVSECLKLGFKKIIFFDPACILVDKVDDWFEMIKDYGVLAAQDDSKLFGCVSDIALKYFGVIRDDIYRYDYHLVGGSVYVFDFNLELCREIFTEWELAENYGIFGSQNEASTGLINSHRNDETVMALCLYQSGNKPVPCDILRYNNVENPIVIKKHWK